MLPLFAVVVLTLLELAVAGSEPFLRGHSAGGQPPDRRRVDAKAGLEIAEPGSSGDAADKYGGGLRQVGPAFVGVPLSPGGEDPPPPPQRFWLAEDDLVLTQWQYEALYWSNRTRHKRKTLRTTVPWPDAVLPYVVIPWDFTGEQRAVIHQAMEEWEEKTCVKFRQATASDKNRVVIQNGMGCNSQLGTVGGAQALNLESPGCRYKGLYLHELGHALGLLHEHQLPYRGAVVEILLSNVKSDWRRWFDMHPAADVESFGIPYDLSSIMHYGSTAFSGDGRSETIRTKDSTKQSQIVDVYLNELAFSDIKAVSLFYKCNASCTNVICSGQGFVGKNCTCVCPDGSSSCQVSPPPPRETPTAVPKCVNLEPNASCTDWAKRRECAANPLWMTKNCRQSCKKCGILTPPNPLPPKQCDNLAGDDDCASYARSGECAASAAWMLVNCTAACGACALRSRGECFDAYPDPTQCRVWRNQGACDYHPSWMWANCRQTCDVCGSKPAGCANILPDDHCYAAATIRECFERPEYMRKNCAKACGKCGSCYNELMNDALCYDLAMRGECANAYQWMESQCKKACKFCGAASVPDGQPRPCVDLDANCPKWASEGECDKNVGWMTPNCQFSCGKCNCTNKHANQTQCDGWAASGECSANPTWMIPNCQRSCSACTNIAPAPDKCVNTHPSESDCRRWAASGECLANPMYMIPYCRKACTGCSSSTGVASTVARTTTTARTTARTTTARPGSTAVQTGGRPATTTAARGGGGSADCFDVYNGTLCRQWANADHCRINPGFMNKYCARSCGMCTPSATSTSTPVTTKATPTPTTTTVGARTAIAATEAPVTTKATPTPTTTTVGARTATAATVSTTQAAGDEHCQNLKDDAKCDEWAESGMCTDNAIWMEYYCAKSCNACNPNCDDAYVDQCARWSADGQCQQNALWMKYYCYKSCYCSDSFTAQSKNHVTTAARSTIPPTTTFVTEVTDDWIEDYDDSVCADKDPKCPAWAQAGQCMAHLEFAKANCQLSCEICTPGACTDGHVNCPLWASSGKCHLFAYARKTCQLSCKICSIPDWMP